MKAILPKTFSLPLLDSLVLQRILPEVESIALDVLCVNCEEFIENDTVDIHSRTCFRTSKALELREIKGDVEMNRGRLERLQEFVGKLVKTSTTPTQQSMLLALVKACRDTAAITNREQLSQLAKLKTYIKTSAGHVTNSPAVQVCSDRVVALIEEREKVLVANGYLESQKELDHLQDEVRHYREKTAKLKASLVTFNRSSLDVVKSEVNSIRSGYSSASSTISETPDFRISTPELEDSVGKSQTLESVKRLFYSTCLAVKLSFPRSHPGQKESIAKLFRIAMQEKIPADKWRLFISGYLARMKDIIDSHETYKKGHKLLQVSMIEETDEQE